MIVYVADTVLAGRGNRIMKISDTGISKVRNPEPQQLGNGGAEQNAGEINIAVNRSKLVDFVLF